MSDRPSVLKNPTVLGIGVASFFSDLSHEAVTSVLPALLAASGSGAAALGMIEGIADGASSVAKLFGGVWADRLEKRKPFCAVGYATMGGSLALIAAATAWPLILFGRTLGWISRGLRSPAKKILLSEAVASEDYGKAFGLERTMDTLGAVLAPIAASALIAYGLTVKSVIWWSVVPAMLAVFAILFLVKEPVNANPPKRGLSVGFRELPKSFRRLLVVVGIFGAGDFAHSMLILFAIAKLTPAHGAVYAATAAAGLYTLRNVLHAFISFPVGYLADRMSKPVLLACGYAIGALLCVVLVLANDSLIVLGGCFILAGLYAGIEETMEDALAAEVLPRNIRGTGFGTLAVVNGLGDMISSIAVGWLWHAYGSGVAFGFAGYMMAAGAIGMFIYGSTAKK